jgi:alkanesulfonate monooxygenase SsuD/methylene tetrahydromethanopterin reductase-like flavin-dependent oxidoreductase (luciferase family)
MRFGYHATMCNPAYYAELAKAAEAAGYDTFTLPDSICYPKDADSKYPYNDDGSREFLDGVPFIEPFSLVPWMAAVTSKLKFSTSVLKLPIRNPVILAKQVTSVAVLTGNRFELGVGLSPWKEDFLATETDYDTRGQRMEHILAIYRGLESGDYFGYESEYYNFPPIKLCPVPTKPVKILYGSHSEPGMRRAAKLCNGWISAGGHMNELAHMIGRLGDYRKQFGTDDNEFDLQVMGPEVYNPDAIKRLADMGVQECHVAFRNAYAGGPDHRTVESMIGEMNQYADTIIKEVRG